MAFKRHLDPVKRGRVDGWTWDRNYSTNYLTIIVLRNGQEVARSLANQRHAAVAVEEWGTIPFEGSGASANSRSRDIAVSPEINAQPHAGQEWVYQLSANSTAVMAGIGIGNLVLGVQKPEIALNVCAGGLLEQSL